MLEQFVQVAAVACLVEEMTEDDATVHAIVFELVRHPIMRVSYARKCVELQTAVDIQVVEIHRTVERHCVRGELVHVVDHPEMRVLHQHVHCGAEGSERALLLEHPRENRLAGEQQRARVFQTETS